MTTLQLAEVLVPERCALYWNPDTDSGVHVMGLRNHQLDRMPEEATLAQLRRQFGKQNVMVLDEGDL